MAYGSILFNDSPNYLSLANATSNLVIGTASFTVEAWVYLNNYNNTNMLLSKDNSLQDGGAGSWYCGINNGTGEMQFGQSGTDYFASTGPIVPLQQWCHLAYVRNGTTLTVWLNGSSSASITLGTDLNGTGELRIGRGRAASTNYFAGYIHSLRYVIGTAVYTASFTPATEPLPATANTQLLVGTTHEVAGIPDYSGNNYTLTRNGTMYSTSSFNPFSYNPTRTLDSLNLSQAVQEDFVNFIRPNASKTLYISASDALIDKTVTNPEQNYQEVYF